MKPGDKVRNIISNRIGTVRSTKAFTISNRPGWFVEIVPDDARRPHIWDVWDVNDAEKVEE